MNELPADSPPPYAAALRWALIVAMTFPVISEWLYFMVLPGTQLQDNPLLQWVFGINKVALIFLPLTFRFLTDRQSLRPGFITGRGMGLALGFALATSAAILALYFLGLRSTGLFDTTPAKVRTWLAQMGVDSTAGFLTTAAFISIVHSLIEEYYWRWFVYGGLRRLLPLGWALPISAVAFMGHHVILLAFYLPDHFWTAAVPFSVGVGIGGAVWAWIYERCGSIYAVWFSHALIDAALMVVGLDLFLSS